MARVDIAENPDSSKPQGFRDRFRQAYDSFAAESQTVSRDDAFMRAYDEQVTLADNLGVKLKNPYNTDDVPALYARQDMRRAWQKEQERTFLSSLEDLAKKYPDAGFKTQDQIMASIQEEARELRDADALGGKNSTGSGDIGAALGVMAGAVSDPVVLLTLPFGGIQRGTGAGIKATAERILRTASIEAGIGAGAETLIQPGVYQYKKEIESPYTINDAAINVLAAGAGGAFFGGVFQSGAELLRAYRANKPARPATSEERAAEKVLEDINDAIESNPFDKSTEGEAVHLDNIRDAQAATLDGEPVQQVKQSKVESEINYSQLQQYDPDDLLVDAERFQFKAGGNAEGVTSRLAGLDEFDQKLAGISLVYEDAAGKPFIVDGHQRRALAKRAKAKGQKNVKLNAFLLRADEYSEGHARAIAAFKNIAEGTGSPTDAAKILREVGERGLPILPPTSALVRNARGLARLSDDAFGSVVNGDIPENYAALIGRLVEDRDLHNAIVGIVQKTAPRNAEEAEAIIRQAMQAGFRQGRQQTLFGDDFIKESLIKERSQLLGGAISRLRKDKSIFKTLTQDKGTIEGAGNKLDNVTNAERLKENEQIIAQIQASANRRGTISDTLNKLAREVADGRPVSKAVADLVESIRRSGDQFVPDGPNTGTRRPDRQANGTNDGRRITASQSFERLKEMEKQQDEIARDLFDAETRIDDMDEDMIPIGEAVDPDSGLRVAELVTRRDVIRRAKQFEKDADIVEACIRG